MIYTQILKKKKKKDSGNYHLHDPIAHTCMYSRHITLVRRVGVYNSLLPVADRRGRNIRVHTVVAVVGSSAV